MKKSTIWLVVGIASVVLFMIAGCCAFLGSGSSEGDVSGAATANVDLEKLTKTFEAYVQAGRKDLNGFERDVNDKSKGIYTGTEPVKVTMVKSGAVLGYNNKDADPAYNPGSDTKVFELNINDKERQVVATDRHDNYYRYQPSYGGFFTGYLVGSMLSGHRGYYPGGYYRAPAGARFQRSGYYNRMRSSAPRSSGFRSGGSFGGRSGGRSGGFGFGK